MICLVLLVSHDAGFSDGEIAFGIEQVVLGGVVACFDELEPIKCPFKFSAEPHVLGDEFLYAF